MIRDQRSVEIVAPRHGETATSRENVGCNLCGGATTHLVGTQRGLRIVRCRGCGLVYVDPRPQAQELTALYSDYHARGGQDEASWDRLMRRVFR